MQQSEKQIERDCCRYAQSQGWMSLKLVSPNVAGVPDRMFISTAGTVEFVEFKTEVGRLSVQQERIIKVFKAHNRHVHVIHSLAEFKVHVLLEM